MIFKNKIIFNCLTVFVCCYICLLSFQFLLLIINLVLELTFSNTILGPSVNIVVNIIEHALLKFDIFLKFKIVCK